METTRKEIISIIKATPIQYNIAESVSADFNVMNLNSMREERGRECVQASLW